MNRGVWIYFDLGVQGDYEGMFAWLDSHRAHECGENLAFVRYEFTEDLFEEIKADMVDSVELKRKDRVYVVFKDDAEKVVGKFLYGRRMRAPWTGYGSAEEGESEDAS